jgi:hypothetical protein
MRVDRSMQVLTIGLKAACERLFSGKGLRRPEYPQSLQKMYSDMEDALFALFNAIEDKKYTRIREHAADIIVIASEIVEYAELLGRSPVNKPWDTEDER